MTCAEADGTGWRIQLENGLCIDVADSEELVGCGARGFINHFVEFW